MFETERLRVRRLEEADAEFLCRILTDPGFVGNIGDRGVRSAEDARGYFHQRIETSYEEHGFGMSRVALKAGDVPIGITGLVDRKGLTDAPDVGFAFLAAHVGRGYGYEAGRGLIDWARDAMGFTRLLGITSRTNTASAGLLGKLGFRECGALMLPDHAEPSRLFERG